MAGTEVFQKLQAEAVKVEKETDVYKTLSMEEAKAQVADLFPSKDPREGSFRWAGRTWPFTYVRPSFGVESAATQKGFKIGSKGEMQIDHQAYAIEILLKCIREAPFDVDRETLLGLDAAVITQIASQITEGMSVSVALGKF